MSYQSEQQLEDNFIAQLQQQQFERIQLNDAQALRDNLRKQLSALNNLEISETEFRQVRNTLIKGNVFDKAKLLRDRISITRDDGSTAYIRFLADSPEENIFQVTNQVTIKGRYKNRYDVTVLVNGLPLIQIELKRRGLELKEAFNQVNRYQRHSYWAEDGIFQFVQIFVISNGVNTKYYANFPSNRKPSF